MELVKPLFKINIFIMETMKMDYIMDWEYIIYLKIHHGHILCSVME